MLKAYVTASFVPEKLELLKKHLNVAVGGWGFAGKKLKPAELIEWAHDADILVVGYEEVTRQVVESLPNLKLVACARGGFAASVDAAALTDKGIPLIYTPGRNADAVADLAIGLLLAVCRRITRTANLIYARQWDQVPWDMAGETEVKRFSGPELAGKTIGLIGFGAVGRKVAARAKGFSMEVLVHDPYLAPTEAEKQQVGLLPLKELLGRCDFLVVCAKLTPETTGMLSYDQFRLMKRGTYIVNVARGAIIDEEALVWALKDKLVAGAGLDVLIDEPVRRDHPLLDFANVTITPHLGGASDDLALRQSIMISDDILAWLKGEKPRNLANPPVYGK